MSLPKRYNPKTAEPRLDAHWQATGVYHFDPDSTHPVYSIDTPPATVSGHLHMGHVYSYNHTDFLARFWRMNGRNVFYPMGYDDNGLPTERLVERWENVRPSETGRRAFIERCLLVSAEAEKAYQALWQRLGLSIDWRQTYRTIDDHSRRIAQWSFLDLHKKGLAYRQQAPTIWCPECQTAIAQAELDDLDRPSIFYTVTFELANGHPLPIATTRPELLPACVAIFVHPEDSRYTALIGSQVTVPYFGQTVPLLADSGADPGKGTGAVMCCTFGDTADVEWWHTHELPLIEAIGRDGRMTTAAGPFATLTTGDARQQISHALQKANLLQDEQPITQSVRVHERCDTPVEYIVTGQWFINILEHKEILRDLGEKMAWHPPHMKNRYTQWVENLGWDWCISRQRYFGVPIPVWYCLSCETAVLPDAADLPIDPTEQQPEHPCACGSTRFRAESDVMDTWFTSSMSPQIVGRWQEDDALYQKTFPYSLRPQAHEIIRTWAFYTIVKSHYHFGQIPWDNVAISGWGLAPEGMGKISKSRGGGPVSPMAMIEQYSADAVRYWAASTGPGKDAIISEEKIQAGAKLVTKLWNVSRFAGRFLDAWTPPHEVDAATVLTPADRWILARTQQIIDRSTALFQQYDYATAKSETESFFWRDLADNYLEMSKKRLYDGGSAAGGARFSLYHALLATLKLMAPFLPYVTEQIYLGLFADSDGAASIHRAHWPKGQAWWRNETAIGHGQHLVDIATAIRRYKSEHNLSLGTELPHLYIASADSNLTAMLSAATEDLSSITRAQKIIIDTDLREDLVEIATVVGLQLAVNQK